MGQDVILDVILPHNAPLPCVHLRSDTSRFADESRRLAGSNCAQGLSIVDCLACREAYVYAMGQEPWLNYVSSIKYTAESRPIIESSRMLEACRERGIVAERLFGEKEILMDVTESSLLASDRHAGVSCRFP